MLRSKAMTSMFRMPFLYFSSLLDFYRIGFVIMTIFLLMHLLSFVDEFCTIVIPCVFVFVYVMLCYLW